jgi:hypothetical protein
MEAKNTTPSARATDPATSHAAAASMREESKGLRAELLAVYQGRPTGLTMDEAAELAGIPTWAASKRISELRAAGMIVDTGLTRPGRSGRLQAVCRCPDPSPIPESLFIAPKAQARYW